MPSKTESSGPPPAAARGTTLRGAPRALAIGLVLLAWCLGSPLGARRAGADPARFGDSTWVAPVPAAESPGEPTVAGPRVAPPDHERTWETVLRAPFRVGFLPLRIVARGLEWAAGYVGEKYPPYQTKYGETPPRFKIGPTVGGGPALGIAVDSPGLAGRNSRLDARATWAWLDHRNAQLRHVVGLFDSPVSFTTRGDYDFRPNRRFYGLGNFSRKADRSIYLQETGSVRGLVRIGPTFAHQLRLLGGYSSISSRRGFNDHPAAADLFSPAAVPFLLRESRMVYYGAGGDVAVRDDPRDPSRGLHGRAELLRFNGVDKSGVDYTQVHLEGRAYVPVFAARRVLAFRGVYRFVHPDAGSTAIPFYRLPTTKDETKFAAYRGDRFRDRHLAIAHVEYRWRIFERVSALALAELGEVASSSDQMRIADVHESYGGGLRYATSESAVFRFEIAKGSEGMVFGLELGGLDF